MKTLVLTENSFMYFGETKHGAVGSVDGPRALIAIAERMVHPANSAKPYPAQDVVGPARTPKKKPIS